MGISGDMGLRRAVIIIFIIALLPLSILEVKADSNIGYQELVEVEVNSADTVEMENARYNRPDSISVILYIYIILFNILCQYIFKTQHMVINLL